MIASQNFFHVTMEYVKGKCILFLFAVFMNDLESYLTNCNLNGFQTISNEIETQLGFNEKLRFLGSLPLEKTITLLLSVFTLSFQIEQ
jgi:hypothetical protein